MHAYVNIFLMQDGILYPQKTENMHALIVHT